MQIHVNKAKEFTLKLTDNWKRLQLKIAGILSFLINNNPLKHFKLKKFA